MFTGIVEELGEVVGLEQLGAGDAGPGAGGPGADGGGSARLTVRAPLVTAGAGSGDSVAVNGVCLTVTGTAGGQFTADVMGETLRRSSLGSLTRGARVNLERPLRLDGRLGGHLVQGHVDAVGQVQARTHAGNWDVVRIGIPARLMRYVIEKGSVAVDGVSLTVSAVSAAHDGEGPASDRAPDPSRSPDTPQWFEVSLIPETLARTTLGSRQAGEAVNLEVDMIAKYVQSLLGEGARP